MTFQEFDALVERTFDKIRALRDTKGKEYANNDNDRLANFKDIAFENGISPLVVLNIYASKHTRAISNYCKTGTSKSNETIESRILDRIVYDLLLLGLVEDLKGEKIDTSIIEHAYVGNADRNEVCKICNYAPWYFKHLKHEHVYLAREIPNNGICVCGKQDIDPIHPKSTS